jgi:NAD(P)-dependent dehydrogenase (short-subunit alcohol dehydrogenase family)
MQAKPELLPIVEANSAWSPLPNDLFLITEDQLGVASLVAEALHQKGAKTLMINCDRLRSSQAIKQLITEASGCIKGIIHLAGLAALKMPDNLTEWRNYTQIHSKSLFQLLQLAANDLQPQGRILAASLLGGYFGRDGGGAGLATAGSSTGLLKTLRMEWADIHPKALDFDDSLTAPEIAKQIINELLSPGRLEVGYPQGKRTIFQTVSAPVNREILPQINPASDWVVLVTGGAQGITAKIVQELLLPGMTLIVVGRSPEPDPESSLTAGVEDQTKLRQIMLTKAQAQGKVVTPKQIEDLIGKLKRDRAIRNNLAQFRQTGASVFYETADVRNAEEFGKLIDHIYTRYHRLDGVIHGAGIIEDKLIVDKTRDSLERVFDTKVDSTFTLYHHLQPESLKFISLFSSVAGRCGNRGQSDYGAANEVMNRLAWQMDREWTYTRVVAINWGPWDTTGMASDQVKRQFKERGIIPIPLDAGCQFFVEELCYGVKGETEVIAGEGPWEEADVFL